MLTDYNIVKDRLEELKKESFINPQVETGFRRIENRLFYSIINSELLRSELLVLLCIIHYVWGYEEKIGKIKLSWIQEATKLSKKSIYRALKSLSDKKIIALQKKESRENDASYMVAISKYFDIWNTKNNEISGSEFFLLRDTDKPYLDMGENSTLYIKEKRNIRKFLDEIIQIWNSLKIKNHKNNTHSLSEKIRVVCSFINEDQLINAIQNYGEIYHSQKYFFTYKYTLSQFLHSGNMYATTTKDKGYWQFLPEAQPFIKFKKQNYAKSYFDEIRLHHPFPKIGVKSSDRLSGITDDTYLCLDIGFLENDPYERYQLLFEGKDLDDIDEDYIIHIENIIVILLWKKGNEEFLRKCVDLHLTLLKKYDIGG